VVGDWVFGITLLIINKIGRKMVRRIVSSVLGIRVKEVRNHKALEVIPGTVTGLGRGKK
jgi:acid phosphatase family membrane protein YuiD